MPLLKKIICVLWCFSCFTSMAWSGNHSNRFDKFSDFEIGGYLFAHMTRDDYGRLYYSLSKDGMQWQLLYDGNRVNDLYKGHPDIIVGHDNRFYMTGNIDGSRSPVTVWQSDDLLEWVLFTEHVPNLSTIPDFNATENYFGAPKIFYDNRDNQYIITWHSTSYEGEWDFLTFWGGMRTFYITSEDLKTFSDPRRLFNYDIATIDVIIRQETGKYFAFIKDEKYPDFDWPTGKAIRVAQADHPLGPYSEPSDKISASFREAPTIIPSPDKGIYYLYYEKYPGLAYEMSVAPSMHGPWIDFYSMDFSIPAGARHGCMIPITAEEFEKISQKYGPFEDHVE
jgi:hypothetical protein